VERSGATHFGIIDGETVRASSGLASFDEFIALDPSQRRAATAALDLQLPLAGVTLDSPLRPRKNVFCVGRNYLAHAEEGARVRGEELKLPPVPTLFTKAPTSIVGPDVTIELDERVSQQWDWEAELAIVIGERCRDVDEDRALEVVFGYTALNDVTARDLQRATTQWFKGKTLDQTCPIGPWIVDAQEFGDPATVDVKLRVNGVEKQNANTRSLIFSCQRIISYLSQGLTLEPGDVIATGTPEGVGFARTPPEFLHDGDVMEVEISRIGILRTPVRIAAGVAAAR
jgi:2-keto-4-pentenoate hydratase/2-oxohepta-3-ene-1,7-dioic acid hydratase in catechol pathway